MPDPTLQEVASAVSELREEIKRKSGTDHEKIEQIQTFLDSHEEKVNQPLVRAQLETEKREAEIKELSEKLEKTLKDQGERDSEVKDQIQALELELARGGKGKETPDYHESDEYKALSTFCQYGERGLSDEQKQLLRTDSAVDGGFLVITEMDTQITKKITEIDPIRSVARVRSISSKSIELPIRNTIPTAAYEGEQETGTDSTSTYQAETVTPFRQTFTTPITIDQLQDAAFDMEAEITADAGEAFGFGEGQGFVSGTGFKEPAGFTSNANLQTGARETAASGVLDPEALILLTGDLKVGYNPVYVLNRRTLATIRTFRADAVTAADSAGGFLWAPGFQDRGIQGPVGNTLNGFPYILANSMPDIAGSAFAVAFGDFRRGYTIVDRTGMSVVRDEFTLKKRAIVEFTMNRWNTGQVTLEEPIKLLKIKA